MAQHLSDAGKAGLSLSDSDAFDHTSSPLPPGKRVRGASLQGVPLHASGAAGSHTTASDFLHGDDDEYDEELSQLQEEFELSKQKMILQYAAAIASRQKALDLTRLNATTSGSECSKADSRRGDRTRDKLSLIHI